MASLTDICNMSLGQLSRPSISDIGTVEDSQEWRECNRYVTVARDFVLEDVWWNFARKYVQLSLLSETPREWLYMYAKPSNAMAVRYLLPNYTVSTTTDDITIVPEFLDTPVTDWPRRVPFAMGLASDGSEVIMSNEVDAYCCFTSKVTDTTTYSAGFTIALMWYLTHFLAMPLMGGDQGIKKQKAAIDAYAQSVSVAGRNDFNQQLHGARPDSDLVLARR